MRTLTYQLRDLKKVTIEIGFEGENNRTQVRIDCGEVFAEYPNAEAALKVQAPKSGIYPATVTRDGNMILWTVRDCDVANNGNGEFQLTFTDGETVVKSCRGKIHIDKSLKGSGTAPSGVQDWLERAEEVLEGVEAAEIHQPMIGLDGYWYKWDQEAQQYVSTGTKAQGQNGVGIASIVKTGTVGLVDTYTITFTNGTTTTYTVTNGEGGAVIDDTTPAVNKVFSSSKVNTELNTVKNTIQEEKAGIEQIAKDGYQKYFPEWERGAWGLSGKEVNANSMRSKDLIYLPSGVYTVYSVDPMSVFTYYDTEAQDGGNPQWKQTGEKTITITTRNYVGFAVEWASTETGNPTGNYAIIPSAVSDVIAKANKTANDLTETSARTVYSDGTFNAVLQNVTVTENKGIGSGVQVGSVVSLTNDTYSQVMEVPVTAGRTYRMKARVYANYFIAHFTDSNNILIEKTGKNASGATLTMIDFVAVAPAGATKLYIAGMKNTQILCDVFNPYTVKDIISMNENKARGAFCIMEFNVGDWYQGIYRDGDKTGIIPADETIYEQYMTLFREIFNRYKPDIALLNEEAQNMCMNRHDDSRAFLGEWWKYQYRGLFMSQDKSDVFNTIASFLPLSDITVRNFTDTESNMHRNYIKGYMYLNGKKICVICAHLSSNIDIAKLNATELLNDLQTEDPEYLICCGDFNYDTNVPEIAAFETAGYTISRGNVVYDGHTYGPGDLVVTTPNITVKSCFCDEQKIGSVEYIDHLPTVAYLEIF